MGGGQRRSRRSTLQAWGYYLLALMAWVTIVLVVSVLGFIICRSLIWYETNPLYQLLNWVRDYYFFLCIAVVLTGWVVISYFFIARPVGQVEAMARAAERRNLPLEDAESVPGVEMPEPSPILSAVQALPAKYSAVIHLYYYEGYSIKEIANLLRLPVPTVGTRLSRGRERLRQILKEDVE